MLSRILKAWDLLLVLTVFALAIAWAFHESVDPFFDDPELSYSANFNLLYGTHVASGVVRHKPGWTRLEMGSKASPHVYIDDLNRDKSIRIVPKRQQYEEIPRSDHPFNYLQECFGVVRVHGAKRIADTTYEGIPAVQYRSTATNYDITYWISADGLLLRFKGQATSISGLTFSIDYRLSRIELAPQAAELFVPPQGYSRVSTTEGSRR